MPLTDNPDDPRIVRGGYDTKPILQHEVYLVLSKEERTKGFIRPLRLSYVHVGRSICGDTSVVLEKEPPGGKVFACSELPGHEGEHTSWMPITIEEALRGRVGGCGSVTTMGIELAETYARQPDFYGATYCATCMMHRPVGAYGEFVWDGTNEKVGT